MSASSRTRSRRIAIAIAIAGALLLPGCGEESSPVGPPPLFGPDVDEVVFEVDYQPGAAPQTSWNSGGSPWQVFEANMEALFEVHPRRLTIPRTLDQMQPIDVTGDRFTYDDLIEIATTHRDRRDTGSVRAFYFVFLDGLYYDEVREYPDLLGVSVRDAGIVVVFKPVVGDGELGAYYEQTTLVHEFGHAIGLVNAGLPMVEDHEDPAHPRHCSNDACIMEWLNEAPSGDRSDVPRTAWPPTSALYGDQCLADVHAAAAEK